MIRRLQLIAVVFAMLGAWRLSSRADSPGAVSDAVLQRVDEHLGSRKTSWAESLKAYEDFAAHFPASPKAGYARETADLLREMIAEEADHHPKPLEQMSAAEQVAENIYQLRNLAANHWMFDRRLRNAVSASEDKEVVTPADRLVDFGYEAVPQLIEALDDKRFTRSTEESFRGPPLPRSVMRVSGFALRILDYVTGQNFHPRTADDGRTVVATTRQVAEAWWAEVQRSGEKQNLIKTTASGGEAGCEAARTLAREYPHAALDAIETGIRGTKESGLRGEYVEAAGSIPGDGLVAFLRSQLEPANGLDSQVNAAKALLARGSSEGIPAMIEAWRSVQSRLSANEGDAFAEVGGLIEILASSGDARAIDALGRDVRKAPVEVRLAVVEVFQPWELRGTEFVKGRKVHVLADMPRLPGGPAGAAIERLLAAGLDDTERRIGMRKDYYEASIDGPRVCDVAALVLSQRWPGKYRFHWAGNPVETDAQITIIRDQWRAGNGLPAPVNP
jgi:hypothetical protein